MGDQRDALLAPRRVSPAQTLAAQFAATGGPRTVAVREIPFLGQVELRLAEGGAEAAAGGRRAGQFLRCPLPEPGRVSGAGSRHVLWCGPGWYLVVDSTDTGPGLEAGLQAVLGDSGADLGSAVDVSALRTTLELTGPCAEAVLAHGCTLDLHPRVFGPGRCAQTPLAGCPVILHRSAPPTFRVLVRASYAIHLGRWLLDAMTEYLH